MSIDVERSGFTLVQQKPHAKDEIWRGEMIEGHESLKRVYAPDKAASDDDLPFVEMKTTSKIQY
jgi:hypothetical protein